jgi:hypothetical protein
MVLTSVEGRSMVKIPYWIQRADFTTVEHEAVDEHQAHEILCDFDWASERALRDGLKNENQERCDPGIGFVAADGRILHISSDGRGRAYFHYHFRQWSRLLGLIPFKRRTTRSNMKLAEEDLDEVVMMFFHSDHEWLMGKTSLSE